MLQILEYYTSGFWVWSGLTIGLAIVVTGAAEIIVTMVKRK